MNAKGKTDDAGKTIDEDGNEVLDPRHALAEQTLAVDLQRADIDLQISTAHKFPRSIDVVLKKLGTMVLYNEEAAKNSIYALPRGGKPIVGASIGFANALASAWGNCIDGARIVYVDRKEKKVNAEGVFHDLETNRRVVIPEDRRISDKNGRLFSDDMIIITGKAAASVARRNAILNVVPRPLWFPVFEQALEIVRGKGNTFAERKAKALAAFAQFGVKPEQIYGVLGLKGEPDLTLEHMPLLIGMYQTLRDGSETVESMFDPRRMTGKGFETVENPLGEPADHAATVGEDEDDLSAGMGEAPGAGSAPAAAASPPPAVRKERGAASPQGTQQNAPAASPEPNGLKDSAQVATGAAVQPGAVPPGEWPTDAAGYLDYWEGFCASVGSAGMLQDRWTKDRDLRKTCGANIEPHFSAAKQIKEAREADLRKS